MRGKPLYHAEEAFERRITPARAGKTFSYDMGGVARTDHPRACGENGFSASSAAVSSGSPPRVRGKLEKGAAMANRSRITPARAGKTYKRDTDTRSNPDHPRACGENWSSLQSVR